MKIKRIRTSKILKEPSYENGFKYWAQIINDYPFTNNQIFGVKNSFFSIFSYGLIEQIILKSDIYLLEQIKLGLNQFRQILNNTKNDLSNQVNQLFDNQKYCTIQQRQEYCEPYEFVKSYEFLEKLIQIKNIQQLQIDISNEKQSEFYLNIITRIVLQGLIQTKFKNEQISLFMKKSHLSDIKSQANQLIYAMIADLFQINLKLYYWNENNLIPLQKFQFQKNHHREFILLLLTNQVTFILYEQQILFNQDEINQYNETQNQQEINNNISNTSNISEYISEIEQDYKPEENQDIHNILLQINTTEQSFSIQKQELICPICYLSTNEYITMSCKHHFCNNCVQTWINSTEQLGQFDPYNFQCMQENCNIIMSIEQIQQILKENQFNQIFEKYIQKGCIQCPYESCKTVFVNEISLADELYCPNCSNSICPKCYQKTHSKKLCQKFQFLLNNQKDNYGLCPNCLYVYTKDSGCDHVKCLQCQTEFCYQCSCLRSPIMIHGCHYHRPDCLFYNKFNPSFDKYDQNCQECIQKGQLCERPQDFQSFLNEILQ